MKSILAPPSALTLRRTQGGLARIGPARSISYKELEVAETKKATLWYATKVVSKRAQDYNNVLIGAG